MGKNKQEDNLSRVFRLLRAEQELTRQEIAERLGLSMPTTLQIVTDMTAAGLVYEGRAVRSTGGRKAHKICLSPNAGYAVGIEVALHHVELMVMDLLCQVVCLHTLAMPFSDQPAWYQKLEQALVAFLHDHHIPQNRICGAGVSFPGIIDTYSDYVLHSHIFGLKHMSLDRFHRCIPFPTVFANDANCASIAAQSSTRQTFLYVSLNESVGGALVLHGTLVVGDTFHTGEIGHMILIPAGKQCYCGKCGCADCYLSPKALTQNHPTLEAFFRSLQKGDPQAQTAWEQYLDYLAIFLTNLRMLTDMDIILGGEVSDYLAPYLDRLRERAARYDCFARDIDYISISQQPYANACAAGAALLAFERYANDIRFLEARSRS